MICIFSCPLDGDVLSFDIYQYNIKNYQIYEKEKWWN